jgi:hypothetical protein
MKYKITFHRTYEIEEKDIVERLNEKYPDMINPQHSDSDIEEEAELMAMSLMSEEMLYFEDNLNDFISTTIEKIEL